MKRTVYVYVCDRVAVQTKRKYDSYSWNEQTESRRNRNAEETEREAGSTVKKRTNKKYEANNENERE